MKVLCDEHVPTAVTKALSGEGVRTTTVAKTVGTGADDDEILAFTRENEHVILTNDSDFLDVDDHHGVLYYDDKETTRRELVRSTRNVCQRFGEADIQNTTVFLPGGWI